MDTTIDLTLLFLGPIIGAVLGLIASVVLSILARKALAKSAMASSVLGRVRGPLTSRSPRGRVGRTRDRARGPPPH